TRRFSGACHFPVRSRGLIIHPAGRYSLIKPGFYSSRPNTNSNGLIRTNTRILLPGDLFTTHNTFYRRLIARKEIRHNHSIVGAMPKTAFRLMNGKQPAMRTRTLRPEYSTRRL